MTFAPAPARTLLVVLAICHGPALAIALAGLQGRADPEIHLIPSGYVGEVSIVFRAVGGESPAWEGDARLYRIPETGILLTQAEPNVGMSPAWKFFSITPSGERVPISRIWASTVHDTPENRAYAPVEIFYPRRGRLQAGRLPCDVEYDQYFVGTRAQLLSRNPADDRRRFAEFLQKTFVCR
jgi:hypothetical protein